MPTTVPLMTEPSCRLPLVKDSSTGGLGALGYSVAAAALFYGLGYVVQKRAADPAAAPTLSREHVSA